MDGAPATDWAAKAFNELASMSGVLLLPRATVFGYYDHNYLAILERLTDHLAADATPAAQAPRQRLWKVRSQQVVLANHGPAPLSR